MAICVCLEHEHDDGGPNPLCRLCYDCCRSCGGEVDIRKCPHDTDEEPIRVCSICGWQDGEHNWEVHSAELRGGW